MDDLNTILIIADNQPSRQIFMKNILLLSFALFISISAFTQHPKGITDVIEVKSTIERTELLLKSSEDWIYLKDDNMEFTTYISSFSLTPVGLKHAIEKTTDFLNENSHNFNEPLEDNSLLPSWAKSIYDYSGVNTGVMSGDAEIYLRWQRGREVQTVLLNTTREYLIIVTISNEKL